MNDWSETMSKQQVERSLFIPWEELYSVIKEAIDDGKSFTMVGRGNSMRPFLQGSRDSVIFSAVAGRQIRKGDIALYRRDSGQFVIHRVYAVDANGVMTFAGDAQWTLERGIRPDQLRAYVPRVVRKGKVISCEKGFWRNLMTAYMDMRFNHPKVTGFFCHMVYYNHKLLTDPACIVRYLKRELRKS